MLLHSDVQRLLVVIAWFKKMFCMLNVMWIQELPDTFPNEYQ